MSIVQFFSKFIYSIILTNLKCYICKNKFKDAEKQYTIYDLGKVGIIIPQGMTLKDRVCQACYFHEDSKLVKVTDDPSIQIGGIEIHDRVLSEEEIKKMFEKGPPKFEDRTVHSISHKDEDEGYLWIDGKKVRKDKSEEFK